MCGFIIMHPDEEWMEVSDLLSWFGASFWYWELEVRVHPCGDEEIQEPSWAPCAVSDLSRVMALCKLGIPILESVVVLVWEFFNFEVDRQLCRSFCITSVDGSYVKLPQRVTEKNCNNLKHVTNKQKHNPRIHIHSSLAIKLGNSDFHLAS